jgi:adenylosuccinate lyase
MVDTKNLILPGNPRYQPKQLQEFFGYDNLIRYVAEVEIATMETLAEIGIISKEDFALLTPNIREKILDITTTEVDRVEKTDTEFGKKTQHDIRAWVRIAQSILPAPLRRWVHVPLTSYDALDTARALQFSRAHRNIVTPLIISLVAELSAKVKRYAETVQIGRTHGQHALPITVGFGWAIILQRVLMNATELERHAAWLSGKISGAVGAYNAQAGLGILKKCGAVSFEDRVLGKLGLNPAAISTQILPPEHLAHYLFAATMLSATLAQFGRDCRQLMRTEIDEIVEPFDPGQVGSSTMAHKRNPINFENTEGMWVKTKNEFGKVLDTLISEHQRDLVGSSVARDFPIIIINLVQQLTTLLRRGEDGKCFIERIAVNTAALERNLKFQGDFILAEAMYITLQMAGFEGDAHELVSQHAIPLAIKEKIPLLEALKSILNGIPGAVEKVWSNIPHEQKVLLGHPERYIGLAAEKARSVCEQAEKFMREVTLL